MALTRRTWIRGIGSLVGLGLVGGGVTWRWFGRPELADLSGWRGFTAADIALLNEIADLIIPATDTPGAKAADVGTFMALAVTECYTEAERAAFVAGVQRIASKSLEDYGREFASLTVEERAELLHDIERERRWRELWNRGERGLRIVARPVVGLGPPLVQVPHWFTMMKDLTVRGYFTSEVGATQALRHLPLPGAYDGALPYRKGDRAWSM